MRIEVPIKPVRYMGVTYQEYVPATLTIVIEEGDLDDVNAIHWLFNHQLTLHYEN